MKTFVKAAIIKKRHYFGVTATGEIKVVGMEGKKNDRPAWINRVFDQFLVDFKADRDPRVNLRAAINGLENGRINPDLLKIKVKLPKDLQIHAQTNKSGDSGDIFRISSNRYTRRLGCGSTTCPMVGKNRKGLCIVIFVALPRL